VPSLGFEHILSHLPLLQGSLPKNKASSGNDFLRRICQRGSKIHSSSKTPLFFKKKSAPEDFFEKTKSTKKFRRRKMKRWESPETRVAKVSRRSELSSGVNGRSKFRKEIEIREQF